MTITKICSGCGEELPIDLFYKQEGTKDGLKYECRTCAAERHSGHYQKNPSILEKNKLWQQNNKDKHNDSAKKYYHSPTGRLNRGLNKALDSFLGKQRESLFHVIGTSVSALIVHLMGTLPPGFTVEDYGAKWHVGFIIQPTDVKLINDKDIRMAFHWSNLCAKSKEHVEGDFG